MNIQKFFFCASCTVTGCPCASCTVTAVLVKHYDYPNSQNVTIDEKNRTISPKQKWILQVKEILHQYFLQSQQSRDVCAFNGSQIRLDQNARQKFKFCRFFSFVTKSDFSFCPFIARVRRFFFLIFSW